MDCERHFYTTETLLDSSGQFVNVLTIEKFSLHALCTIVAVKP